MTATGDTPDERDTMTDLVRDNTVDVTATALTLFQRMLLSKKRKAYGEHSEAVDDPVRRVLHFAEEAGELVQAERKVADDLRRMEGSHRTRARLEVGDVLVTLCGYCIARDWDIGECLQEVWAYVGPQFENLASARQARLARYGLEEKEEKP